MNSRTDFIEWYHNEFTMTELYANMVQTVENSSWHRERNVGVHTDMVVAQYISRTSSDVWDAPTTLGALACAFHDVGKPVAIEHKFREDRGNYVAFAGHEKVSARLWETYAVRNWLQLQATFELTVVDIYRIGWMIEHHLPYGVKKSHKVAALVLTAFQVGEYHAFCDVLIADAFGRISDDSETKRQSTMTFVAEFQKQMRSVTQQSRPATDFLCDEEKLIFLLIGASGSGKSTWTADKPGTSCSWDDLRLEWYDPNDYARAFELSTKDREFKQKSEARFHEVLDSDDTVIVDNTNISTKSRRFFIEAAKRKGFKAVAVLFPVERDTVVQRQNTRTDKSVPEFAVQRQYDGLQLPSYGEFDYIIVDDGNLLK